MPMSLSTWLLLALLSLVWSAAFILVGIILRELPPLTLVFCRLALSAALLVPVVAWLRLAWPQGLAAWWPFVVMSLFNNVIPFTLLAYGQQEIASGLASVIVATTPLWTVLLTRAFVPGDRIAPMRVVGLVFGIAGVGVLFGPEALTGKQTTLAGMALALIGAMSYGCAGVWGARFRGVPPVVSSCCQLLCSTLIVAPMALLIDAPWRLPMPGAATIWSLVALAVLSTSLAYIMFYRVMASSGGTNAMLVTLIMPPLTIVLGIAVLGETFAARYGYGAAMIALALVMIDGRLPQAIYRRMRSA